MDFYFLVMPLGILVGFLGALVYHLATRKEMLDAELIKLRMQLRTHEIDKKTYRNMRDKLKRNRAVAEEFKKLESLHHNGKIDRITFTRLTKILEMKHAESV